MADDLRIPDRPRGRPATLHLDGAPVRAFEGETVGAALHASGVATLARSIKFHRPRGLFCVRGECANCMMRVDGKPNVRTCMTPVRDGMRVESQNAFPSARRDLLAVTDKVFRKDFDPHERFIRPRFMVPVYNWVIRRMAGFGRVPDARTTLGGTAVPRRRVIRRLPHEVVVVGAGASGLAAAAEIAEGGRRVLVLEVQAAAGGALLEAAPETADALLARLQKAGADVLTATPAVGRYPDGVVAALDATGLLEARPRALVVATGSQDVPPLFPGNDLPGIFSARGALTLVRRDGVRPGATAVVLGAGREADDVAAALAGAGVQVVAVAPAVREARGGARLDEVVLDDGRALRCDALVVCGGRAPRPELAQQAGLATRWDAAAGALVPVRDADGRGADGVWVCGEAAGPMDAKAALEDGARVGKAVLGALEAA